MDLWRGSLADFVDQSAHGAIAGDLAGNFLKAFGYPPSKPEVRSWQHSLPALGSALRGLGRADIGLRIATAEAVGEPQRGQSKDDQIGVAAEYHLPLSNKRVDVLVCGRSATGEETALVVELKQWSTARLEDEFAENVLVGKQEHAHPSRQAADYKDWIGSYSSACVEDGIQARACAYLHNLPRSEASDVRDGRFAGLLEEAPVFVREDVDALREHIAASVGHGAGLKVLDRVTAARFRPSGNVLRRLELVLREDERWHLLDEQRIAHGAILAEVRRMQRRKGNSVIVVRGAPGTGKTVIAIQLLADALRLGLNAAHTTGGKAFTTTLRSQFKGADKLFLWNLNLRKAPFQGLDLLLVDEAHRVRETSDTRFTAKLERNLKSQTRELIEASKVTVFLLDENQFVRPDEVGRTQLFRTSSDDLATSYREYELATQFRCGGCSDYVTFVDRLLGFDSSELRPFAGRYTCRVVDDPAAITALMADARCAGETARTLAGFCWPWSDPNDDGTLVDDVVVGDGFARPWNAKVQKGKSYRPANHPYTLWAETEVGRDQVGCIYSAQGFEFDRVGVIWGEDLVWRNGAWKAQKEHSHDRPVRSSKDMEALVRNAYRVLLTRGLRETCILVLDEETREHLRDELRELG